jgi:exosome complex RNA-binding protein Csl4
MENYSLTFNEEQLFNLRDILDHVLEEDMDLIENPKTDIERSLSRETRVEFVDEVMQLFDIVNGKIIELYEMEGND